MLASWRKGYEKPRQCTKKQRHHFANKGQYSQTYSFSISHVWMWELDQKEGWVQKNWCFQTVVLEKTLESPVDCKEIKPVNLKEINPEYSLEDLKLKLQYFDHLVQRANSLEKTLMLEKIEGKRWKEQQRMKWLDSITNSMDMNLSKLLETVGNRRASHIAVHKFAKIWTQLSDWATAPIPNVWVCDEAFPHTNRQFSNTSWVSCNST